MKRKWLERLFAVCFCIPIALALVTRVLCIRSNQDYDALQPELTAPDMIADVFYEEGRLYVCYNDASYVNVYDGEGSFLWAVSIPYERNIWFSLSDGKLTLSGAYDYVYDAADGTFLERREAEYDEEQVTPLGGGYSFDCYQVYREDPDGTRTTVVSRPGWYWLTNFGVCWLLSFTSGLAYFGVRYIDKVRAWLRMGRGAAITSRRGRICTGYLMAKCVVQLLFAGADVVLGAMGTDISIWLMPLGIHFILSCIIIWNVLEGCGGDAGEQAAFSFWKASDFVTFLAAFFSVIAANGLLGNL